MDQFENKEDYLLSLFEVCEILGKSSRTITRYVHKHVLHPRGIKSRQGTLEYRFSKSEIEILKQREDAIRKYNYMGQEAMRNVPAASFASLDYPASVGQQNPFIIPGISFREDGNAPATARPAEPSPSFVPFVAPQINEEKIETTSSKSNDDLNSRPADNPVSYHNNDEIISLLKETTGMLRDQLKAKDDQIKNLDDKIGQLIERNRETNILLKGLQDKMGLLDKPKNNDRPRNERNERSQKNQPVAPQEKSQSQTLSVETIISEQTKEKEAIVPDEANLQDMKANVVPEPSKLAAYPVPVAVDLKGRGCLVKCFGKINKKQLFQSCFLLKINLLSNCSQYSKIRTRRSVIPI